VANAHDLMIFIEKDDEYNRVNIQFYIDVELNKYFELWNYGHILGKVKHFIDVVWNRIKITFKVLFKGHITLEQDFIIDDEEQLDAFINALNEGRKYVKGE